MMCQPIPIRPWQTTQQCPMTVPKITGANLPGDDVAAPDEVVAAPVGPKDGVHYSADQVASTAAAVREAGAALKAATDKAAVGKAKNAYYRKLYELAEFATFNDDPAGSGQQAADVVLTDTVVDAARFKEVGMAAGKWLEKVQGKEHQGIVLSGSVQDVAKRGQVYETHVLLSDGKRQISVLSAKKPAVNAAEAVVVIGSIVSDPAKSIDGYDGAETIAVWSPLVLPAPAGSP